MKRKLIDIPFDDRGVFQKRENRFLGKVKLDDEMVPVHVRDPGRLEEILYPGNEVLLKTVEDESRKTDHDLIAGKVDEDWILVNSGYHREIAETILEDEGIRIFKDIMSYEAEQMLGESRMDFLLKSGGEETWMEVKGCTLAKEGTALFPDAPTKRGKRHLDELNDVLEEGGSAALMVLVFRPDAECFAPNGDTDPRFTGSFRRAVKNGLDVHPMLLEYLDGTLYYKKKIPLCDR